jgi:hypothetical protein
MKKIVTALFCLMTAFFSVLSFAQKNAGMVQYTRSSGYSANACIDYMSYQYGYYFLAKTPANKNNSELQNFVKNPSEEYFTNTIVPMLESLGLVPKNSAASEKALGSVDMLAYLKTHNDQLDEYIKNSTIAAKICLQAVAKLSK